MSKKQLKNMPKSIRVMAVPSRVIKSSKGEIVKQFYNIFNVG